MTAVLEIRLFGGLEIRQEGVRVSGFVSNKAPALLAYLAVTQRPHQRDTLATLLWGEMGDADAKNNLRQALTSLRKVLEPYLEITRDTVAFKADLPCFVDVVAFSAALRPSRDVGESDIARLQSTVDLYRGDFLDGFFVRDAPEFEDWALAQRTRYRELALQAFHTLTTRYLESADYVAAIDTAGHLLALDAWREEAHRQLMIALARTGQLAAALTQYQSCRRLMLEEFDADPSAETTALYERIRAALRGPRHNLPAALTGFVGRAEEMEALRRRLAMPACRLLTVVGPGGSGKTRLVLEVATALAPAFLNGVWFVSLAAVSPDEPEAVASTLAAALHLALGAGDPRKQLLDSLRQRELLLVLDNLEHLLGGVGWFSQLLVAAPDVKILATSRERLNLQVEQVVQLSGLPIPLADTATSERYAAVELFVRRARRVDDAFELTPQDAPAVAQICRLVGGLPLGIELAAVWVNQLSCQEIAAAIAANLDFLTTARQDVSARQQSLRAAFDHSWRLLSAPEQSAFARLAVFRGSFTRAAAAEVAELKLATLASLVDKSLVRKAGAERYDLHEVLHQFAWEQLQIAPVSAAAVQARHSEFYTQLLARQTKRLMGPEQREALTLVGAEIENVRSAWAAAVEQRRLEVVNQALEGLYHFYMLRSWLVEGLEMFHSARLTLETAAPTPAAQHRLALGRLLTREAKFLLTLSRFEEARALLLHAQEQLRDLEAPADEANARYYLGQVYASTGAYAAAEEQLLASLAARRALGDGWGQAVSLLELAGLCFYRGNIRGAEAYCSEGLVLAEAVGDLQTIAHLLTGLSIVARQLGDFPAARAYVTRGLAVYEDLDNPYGRVQGFLTLGGLTVAQGNHAAARSDFECALTVSREIGFLSGEADSHCRLGQVATALDEEAVAVEHLRLALRLATTTQEANLVFDVLYSIAGLLASRQTPQAGPLQSWLLAQPELDEQRQRVLVASMATGSARTTGTPVLLTTDAVIELAYSLLNVPSGR